MTGEGEPLPFPLPSLIAYLPHFYTFLLSSFHFFFLLSFFPIYNEVERVCLVCPYLSETVRFDGRDAYLSSKLCSTLNKHASVKSGKKDNLSPNHQHIIEASRLHT